MLYLQLRRVAFSALLLLFFSNTALAKEPDGLSVGVGAALSSAIYKEMDTKVIILPTLQMQHQGFYFKALEAGYRYAVSETLSFDIYSAARVDGYDADDSDYLEGMEDREMSLDGGLRVNKMLSSFLLSLEWKHDLLDKYAGHETIATIKRAIGYEKSMLIPFIGASYMSEELSDYYYGVRESEARANREHYELEGAYSGFLGIAIIHRFDPHLRGMINAKATIYSSEIDSSPIVDKGRQFALMGGILYRF